PGGCDFGIRPIDQHIKGFEAIGAKVTIAEGYVQAEASDGIIGNSVYFDTVSVGATCNLMLAAAMAQGTTIIDNAAREPHIVDLANFLNTCGANIKGAGTNVIKVKGVEKLHGCTYAIIPDMIEAGTYMLAAVATHGSIRINNVIPKHLESISSKIEEMGVSVEEIDDSIIISNTENLKKIRVKTLPYPGYPTDMHPQMTATLCFGESGSTVTETVFENRFRYIEELKKMGADIQTIDKTAYINSSNMHGAEVKAVDLRAGAAMVIAGLAADGTTTITDIYSIERGYENIVAKLTALGADIKRVTE
ncbi:MAG: UDP-N-acetylglucosamine 1-carboxyvinyltransferase, partial [Clostridia bacterium]|nr:UDP-N-acetylglucosamine 1-carboxyvinyltransferase [Clostridia bacterium]